MKHGTILRNMYQPSYESYLVYLGTSGKYAKYIWIINGELKGIHNFYKNTIEDREHYPIVGYVDVKKVLKDAILGGIIQDPDWIEEGE